MADNIFKVKFVEKTQAQVKFVEKELIRIKLNAVDVVYATGNISDLLDVSITSIRDKDMLRYNFSDKKWKNERVLFLDTDYNCFIINY